MSIVVTCENGHRLAARDSRAGTIGHCPACGVEVKIPAKNTAPSESSILRILGIGQELRQNLAKEESKETEEKPAVQGETAPMEEPNESLNKQRKLSARKICPQCDWEIDAGYKICPKCRYYFMK